MPELPDSQEAASDLFGSKPGVKKLYRSAHNNGQDFANRLFARPSITDLSISGGNEISGEGAIHALEGRVGQGNDAETHERINPETRAV